MKPREQPGGRRETFLTGRRAVVQYPPYGPCPMRPRGKPKFKAGVQPCPGPGQRLRLGSGAYSAGWAPAVRRNGNDGPVSGIQKPAACVLCTARAQGPRGSPPVLQTTLPSASAPGPVQSPGQQSTRHPGCACPAPAGLRGAASATPEATDSPTPVCCSEAYEMRDVRENVKQVT